ncbi:VanZ family protein [Motilimonas sp. 1_MG-2023]|uniref:VanZ family protein n=1 Tax=Motilimonas TaxID=1914248 RepID=UPI0026E147C8|nr:VanZ family protein [Motilimonas sp. 1_MG-2023]MDO6525652.1 VanZ family protein [Motilimonas sp. 1_MG-2023]
MLLTTAAKISFVSLLVVISYLAFSPAPVQIQFNNMDKINHLAAFASLALVGRCAFNFHAGWLFGLLTGFGALIELVQSQIPNRFASGLDLLADMLGIIIGLVCYRLIQPWLAKLDYFAPLAKVNK